MNINNMMTLHDLNQQQLPAASAIIQNSGLSLELEVVGSESVSSRLSPFTMAQAPSLKKRKRMCRFNPKWIEEFKWIAKSSKGSLMLII